MRASRVRYLEQCLSILGYKQALKALDLVVGEMGADKGFKRHDGSHYYYHLIDATQDLLNHGVRDEITITACLLHDLVEDVEWATIGYVEAEYGEEVAIVVDLVTKKKGLNYKDPNVMLEYLRLISLNWRACLVKTADRKHNFSTLRHATREKKLRQADETETLFIPFFKDCRKLYPRFADYFFSAKTAIEPHLWEIKEHYREVEELEKMVNTTFEDKDILHEYDLGRIQEAFDIVDRVVDKTTVAPSLFNLWNFMSDLIEFNEEHQEKANEIRLWLRKYCDGKEAYIVDNRRY